MPLDQQHEHDRLNSDRGEMSFFDHISELRKHIVRSALAIMVIATIAFIYKDFVFNTIILVQGTRISPRTECFAALHTQWVWAMPCVLRHQHLPSSPGNWGR